MGAMNWGNITQTCARVYFWCVKKVMDNTSPSSLLSVCLITYNHASYIKQAIEGILMQKVGFAWELIIADDFSTDGTREIVIDFQKQHPDFIRLILQEKNVGPDQNWLDLITASKSNYIAYLEGDDYWTDPLKLQRQVDIFLKFPDTVICGARAKTWSETQKEFTSITPALDKDISCMTPEHFFYLKDWIKSGTRVVPRDLMVNIPLQYGMDYRQVHYLLAKNPNGTFRCLDEVVAVYREHAGGVFSGAEPINVQKEYFESARLIAKLYDDERAVIMRENALQAAKELFLTPSIYLKERIYYIFQYIFLVFRNFSYLGMKRSLERSIYQLSINMDRYPVFKAHLRSLYSLIKRTDQGDGKK